MCNYYNLDVNFMKELSKTPTCQLIEGNWNDFREDVRAVEPSLFSIIENIDPSSKYTLIKAKYNYGEQLTKKGTIRVPNNQGFLSQLNDPSVNFKLQEDLGYSPTPLILQLHNACEVFVDLEERIVPLNVFYPGDLYGLYEVLVPITGCPSVPAWDITSGGRSVFLTAKVSENIGHKNLMKRYRFSAVPPKHLKDQWHIMKQIADHEHSPWYSEILIFTKHWFEEHKSGVNWLLFQNYLLKKGWWQSRSNRIQIEYSVMWEAFAKRICTRNLKPNSYIVDTVKHLMQLASGTSPGFKIVDDKEIIMPNKIIEEAYRDCYGLKNYAPIIMHPHPLNSKDQTEAIYYSMAYPTLLIGTPAIRKIRNIMSEIRETKELISTLLHILDSHEERIYKSIKNVKFEYFHSDKDSFEELENSANIAPTDKDMTHALNTRFKNKLFTPYGSFFRGL